MPSVDIEAAWEQFEQSVTEKIKACVEAKEQIQARAFTYALCFFVFGNFAAAYWSGTGSAAPAEFLIGVLVGTAIQMYRKWRKHHTEQQASERCLEHARRIRRAARLQT